MTLKGNDKKEIGGFARAQMRRKVVLDAVLFHAAERRVGDDDMDAIRDRAQRAVRGGHVPRADGQGDQAQQGDGCRMP